LDRITQPISITDHLSVDKNNHVLPDPALFIEYVSAGAFVVSKVPVEYGT